MRIVVSTVPALFLAAPLAVARAQTLDEMHEAARLGASLALHRGLAAHGVSAADPDRMSRKNPARLLGLTP
jgi:hypothetical protein